MERVGVGRDWGVKAAKACGAEGEFWTWGRNSIFLRLVRTVIMMDLDFII